MGGFFNDFDGWWIVVLFFLFLVFQESLDEICLSDWIPFLVLLLILICFDEGCFD